MQMVMWMLNIVLALAGTFYLYQSADKAKQAVLSDLSRQLLQTWGAERIRIFARSRSSRSPKRWNPISREPLSHFTNNQSLNLPFMGLWHGCSISTSVKRIVRQVSSTCVTLDTAV